MMEAGRWEEKMQGVTQNIMTTEDKERHCVLKSNLPCFQTYNIPSTHPFMNSPSLWAYPVCHCWGASAPLGPWGPGPSWAEFPGSRCSPGAAAASPAQRPAAADAAPAASSSAAAAPGDTKERRKGAKVRDIIKQSFKSNLWLSMLSSTATAQVSSGKALSYILYIKRAVVRIWSLL